MIGGPPPGSADSRRTFGRNLSAGCHFRASRSLGMGVNLVGQSGTASHEQINSPDGRHGHSAGWASASEPPITRSGHHLSSPYTSGVSGLLEASAAASRLDASWLRTTCGGLVLMAINMASLLPPSDRGHRRLVREALSSARAGWDGPIIRGGGAPTQ